MYIPLPIEIFHVSNNSRLTADINGYNTYLFYSVFSVKRKIIAIESIRLIKGIHIIFSFSDWEFFKKKLPRLSLD